MLVPTIYPVTCNTKHVGPGSTFVAIQGFSVDGTAFISQALTQGATRIVLAKEQITNEITALCTKHNATLLAVDNPRQALAELAAEALDYPANKLTIIGITGTKGKSTTSMLIAHILRHAGYKTALINTIYNNILDEYEKSTHTTPEADFLQLFFASCVAQGITHVVMEVSSHALSLSRTHGITFSAVGFTNLAREHLDFYTTMENYFAAKAQIFAQTNAHSLIVINADNAWSKQAVQAAQQSCAQIKTFGQYADKSPKNVLMDIQHASAHGILLTLDSTMLLDCPQLFGAFNCYNITMATLIAQQQGVSAQDIQAALQNFKGVPGRLQRHVLKNGACAFVDYAHNPSSMEAVLKTLRPFTQNLIVVFGCGGDRDKTKRPVMGALAAAYADVIIITNDNPRTEDPTEIIAQILKGIPPAQRSTVTTNQDRRVAIAIAAQHAAENSIIALLGKGHEDYYLIGNQKMHLDDLEEIQKF